MGVELLTEGYLQIDAKKSNVLYEIAEYAFNGVIKFVVYINIWIITGNITVVNLFSGKVVYYYNFYIKQRNCMYSLHFRSKFLDVLKSLLSFNLIIFLFLRKNSIFRSFVDIFFSTQSHSIWLWCMIRIH